MWIVVRAASCSRVCGDQPAPGVGRPGVVGRPAAAGDARRALRAVARHRRPRRGAPRPRPARRDRVVGARLRSRRSRAHRRSPQAAMRRLVEDATRTVTAACAAIMRGDRGRHPAAARDRDHRPGPHRRPLPGVLRRGQPSCWRPGSTATRRRAGCCAAGGLACWAWLLAFEVGDLTSTRASPGAWSSSLVLGCDQPGGRGGDRPGLALGLVVARGRGRRGPLPARSRSPRRSSRRALPQPCGKSRPDV